MFVKICTSIKMKKVTWSDVYDLPLYTTVVDKFENIIDLSLEDPDDLTWKLVYKAMKANGVFTCHCNAVLVYLDETGTEIAKNLITDCQYILPKGER